MADRHLARHTVDGTRLKDLAQQEFVRAMRTGRMIAFVGSYASEVFNYPNWGKFLKDSLPNPMPLPGEKRKPAWVGRAIGSLSKSDQPKIENFELLVAYCEECEPGSEDRILDKARRQFELARGKRAANSAAFHLFDSLGIKRFITTNYDLELEYRTMLPMLRRGPAQKRFGEEAELQRKRAASEASQQSRFDYRIAQTTPDGRRIVSDIFHRERPDRLFQFAIGSPDQDIAILHLHGRVTDPKTMIVTQSDYDRHYRRSGIAKLPFEHARNTLFGGNPVLFVGLGMSEAEFLSSLEQFVSDDRPGYLPPTFALWNADSPRATKKKNDHARNPGDISVENDLWRMRVYRKFGTLVLFDTEIEGFANETAHRTDKKAEVGPAIELLGKFVQAATTPFYWKPDDFRRMDGFLPPEAIKTREDDAEWSRGSKVWPVDPTSTGRFLPDWAPAIASPATSGAFDPAAATNDDYVAHLLRDGSPVKLVLDEPGSGHGYLTSVLANTVATQMRQGTDYVYFQINAGFAWEIDTTFGLVSGLFDSKTAFTAKMSRSSAMGDFAAKFMEAIQAGKPMNRRMVMAINGADRFFDSSGYPLSNELDVMLRQLRRLFHGRDDGHRAQYEQWVRDTNLGHPATLLLLGTNRIGRYFDAAGFSQGNIAKGEAAYFDIVGGLKPPFKSTEPPRNLRTRIVEEYRSAKTAHGKSPTTGHAPPGDCPFGDDDRGQSVYLAYLGRAFAERAKTLTRKRPGLGVAAQTLIERASGYEVGNLRFATLEGYLRPEFLKTFFSGGEAVSSQKANACLVILKAMALIGQPVEPATLYVLKSVQAALTEAKVTSQKFEQFLADEVLSLGLITKISPFPGCGNHRYGLHRAVLQDLRDRFTVPISDARSYASFNLPLLAAQPIDDEEPDAQTQIELEKLFDELVAAEEWQTHHGLDAEAYSLRLRAATASVRSYYTTSSMLMYEPAIDADQTSARLSDHARRIDQLTSVAQKIAATPSTGASSAPPPFFPDDLVWLHDQRGVALLAQGDLYGARDSFGEAERLNRDWVEFGDHDHNWRRLQINQLHVDIERGKLTHAEKRVRAIEQSIEDHATRVGWRGMSAFQAIITRYGYEDQPLPRVPDADFPADLVLSTGLCLGYRAWCEQFQGRLRSAEICIERAITILRNLGEQRAYAMFMRHKASLKMALGNRPDADEAIRLCIAASDSVRQLDISHLAWLAKSDYALAGATQDQRAAIQQQFNATLRYASAAEMHRVRMEVRRSLAQMRFAQGDYDGALEQAADAVAVASRFGFSLRKISLRIMIGQILIRRGDPVSGNAMIDRAAHNADRIGFQGAVERARMIRMNDNRMPFS